MSAMSITPTNAITTSITVTEWRGHDLCHGSG